MPVFSKTYCEVSVSDKALEDPFMKAIVETWLGESDMNRLARSEENDKGSTAKEKVDGSGGESIESDSGESPQGL